MVDTAKENVVHTGTRSSRHFLERMMLLQRGSVVCTVKSLPSVQGINGLDSITTDRSFDA